MSLTEPTLLELKMKLKKEKDINILTMIQKMIDKKIEESRDRWWFRNKFFEELAYESSEETIDDLNEELNKPRSMDRFILDSEIINNYSKHIDKPYVLNHNKQIKQKNNLGKRKNII